MRVKEPILFIPGVIAPYQAGSWRYFNDLDEIMQTEYYIAPLDNWGTLEQRSLELKKYIDQKLPTNFHIISHSKGGLDLEYLLDHNPLYNTKVLSHTSLSCPYQGSLIAFIFWILFFPFTFIPRVKKINATLKELFPKADIKPINRDYPQYCLHAYLNIFTPTYPLFWITNLFLLLSEGANDGFVSIKSATKGEVLGTIKTDHIGIIGHFFTNKRKNILKKILEKIESKLNEK